MKPNASHAIPESMQDTGTLQGSRSTLPRRSVRLLLLAFVATAVIVGAEIAHYLVSTDIGILDRYPVAWANVHPLCKEEGSQFDVRCPMPGYNSIPLLCLLAECSSFDPKMRPLTQQMRDEHQAMLRQDKISSLKTEAPYAANSPEWRARAHDLVSGGADPMSPVVLDRRAYTLPEAQRIVQWRSLQTSRQVAQDWLKQHGS